MQNTPISYFPNLYSIFLSLTWQEGLGTILQDLTFIHLQLFIIKWRRIFSLILKCQQLKSIIQAFISYYPDQIQVIPDCQVCHWKYIRESIALVSLPWFDCFDPTVESDVTSPTSMLRNGGGTFRWHETRTHLLPFPEAGFLWSTAFCTWKQFKMLKKAVCLKRHS